MSQPDLISRLRESRPAAPAELRERVRLIAIEASPAPRRRITWRRTMVVLVPVAAAIAAAVVFAHGNHKQTTGAIPENALAPPRVPSGAPAFAAQQSAAGSGHTNAVTKTPSARSGYGLYAKPPAPSSTRLQRYTASLSLELETAQGVAEASRRAVAIVASLSGYQQSITVRTSGKTGYANLVLRVPVGNVREAVSRLSALGRITSEDVSITDLNGQVTTTDKLIASLQRQLAVLRAQTQTPRVVRQIAAVTAHIERLQRGRATTVRTAHFATVALQLATPEPTAPVQRKPGPLHGLGVAFRWIGIGAVYALALGTPFLALVAAGWLLARAVRRRREDRLLSTR